MAKTPVCALEELASQQNFELRYELLPIQDKDASRNTYQYKLTAGSVKVYGKGFSKQEAKHNAAIKAFTQLTDFDNDTSIQSQDNDANQDAVLNIVGSLTKFLSENKFPLPKFELVSAVGESHSKLFTIECKVGTVSLQGTDTTKKKAKNSAAKHMLEFLSEMNPNDIAKMINNHDLNFSSQSLTQEEVRNIYNENSYMCKKKKTSNSIISLYPESIKSIMKDKDLSFDEVWSCYETTDLDQLKYALNKLGINISVQFLQGQNNTTIAFISLDTKPEFSLVEWAPTKKEALDSVVKQTIDFLKIMTQ